MAKTRTTDVISHNSQVAPAAEEQPVVLIEVPLAIQQPPTEFIVHVDLKLTPQQSTIARRIAQQLDLQHARLNNGQRIINVHGAIKWLLEQIAKETR